jgi:hypothetical protein
VCSGDIDFGEFKQMVYDGLLLEGAIQDYEDAFNAVDNSGNGSIGKTRALLCLAWLCFGCCCGLDTVLKRMAAQAVSCSRAGLLLARVERCNIASL